MKASSPLLNVNFEDIKTGYYQPTSWKAVKVPRITKEEYGLEKMMHQRSKYYIYGIIGGGGLITDALLNSRNSAEFLAGWAISGGALVGYAGDYKRQISMKGGGFKARKVYTFADNTKILANDRASAVEVYQKHHFHKANPHHFHLFGIGGKK